MNDFGKFLKYKCKTLAALFVFAVIFAASFYFCGLPLKAVYYPAALCLLIGTVYLIIGYFSARRKNRRLALIEEHEAEIIEEMPSPDSWNEESYQEMIRMLHEKQKRISRQEADKYSNMVDYYTIWAHQIKTPIAAMHLELQGEDQDSARRLQAELKRIESYVNMVMTFLRLDSESTDYIFREYSLDDIIRPVIRSFSSDFINKKLRLEYSETGRRVVTDEKWLAFVIEQVLSNAVKYTKAGSISIFADESGSLCIKDTGIGIAVEDLPRIFENGYTGFNGRADKKASGIGLYLCRRICDDLNHGISAESEIGEGTTIKIDMSARDSTAVSVKENLQ